MPQPKAYNRETDFTERDGDDTDHAAINRELDGAALSINEIRDNLALIQRDDGQLANQSVGPDQLQGGVFDAFQGELGEAVTAAQVAAEESTRAAVASGLSEGKAAESEANAAQSEGNAAASAANAAGAAKAMLDGVYYGALADDPTVDPNGAAPNEGDFYFNTVAKLWRAFDAESGKWVSATQSGQFTRQVFAAGVDFTPGTTAALTLASDPMTARNVFVHFDAAYQHPSEYSLSENVLAFAAPVPLGVQAVEVAYLEAVHYPVADALLAFASKEKADAAALSLPDGQEVEVALDETRAGARTRYKVQAGALVFTTNLDQLRIDLADATDQAKGAALVGFQQFSSSTTRTVQDKLRDTIGPQDFSGTADAAFAAAISGVGQTPRGLDLGGRTVTLTSTPTNTYGAKIDGGKVLYPSKISGRNTQLNSYAPDANGLMVGREHLALLWKYIALQTPFNVYFYGDSTVELGPGWTYKAHDLLQMALQDAGVNNSKVYNRGLSGTSWTDLNAIPDLGAATYLIVIKYGINDAVKSNPLATMATAMRAKLAAIRAASFGTVNQVSILLMGPSSTYSPTNNQDAKWYEDVRRLYIQIAKEFECAYFDTYAYMQETKSAPGFWMDDLTSLGLPGEGLHPDSIAVQWIYRAALKDHVLGDGGFNINKANTFWNLSNYTKPAVPADFPNTYMYGITMQAVFAAGGWPFDGVLKTERYADGGAVQTISTLDPVPRTATRRGINGTWTQWAGVPVAVTTFANSWTAKGAGYSDPGYQVQSDGFVELFGTVANGTLGTEVFTLPSTARPAYAHAFATTGSGTVTIYPTGVVAVAASSNALISLSGIRFKAL